MGDVRLMRGMRIFGDTWTSDYEGDRWTKMSPAKSHAARDYSWMVYDPRGDRVIPLGRQSGHGDRGLRRHLGVRLR
jgi:hypothetical protein